MRRGLVTMNLAMLAAKKSSAHSSTTEASSSTYLRKIWKYVTSFCLRGSAGIVHHNRTRTPYWIPTAILERGRQRLRRIANPRDCAYQKMFLNEDENLVIIPAMRLR